MFLVDGVLDSAFLLARMANHAAWVEQTLENPKNFPYQLPDKRKANAMGYLKNGETLLAPYQQWNIDDDDGMPTYVVSMPTVLSGGQDADLKWHRILETFRDEGFSKTADRSRLKSGQRLFVLLGINRFQSLDSSINQSFKQAIPHLPQIPGIHYHALGTIWYPRRHCTVQDCPDLLDQEKAFRLLKFIAPDVAKQVRKIDDKNAKKHVPYQSIRDWIKDDPMVTQWLEILRQKRTRIFWSTMDGDLVGLRSGGRVGLFSTYDRLIRVWRQDHNNKDPTLLSTGYWPALEEGLFYRVGIEIDMRIREAMAQAIPIAPYYPEPNFLVPLPVQDVFSKIHYTDMTADKNQATESRRFIWQAVGAKVVFSNSCIFRAIPGLFTTLPERFRGETNDLIELNSKDDLFSVRVLKAFKGLPQTHLFKKGWGDQMGLLFNMLGLDYGTKSGTCSGLFGVFDIEIFASLGVWQMRSIEQFEGILQRHALFRDTVFKLLENTRLQLKPAARKLAAHFLPVRPELTVEILSDSIVEFINEARDNQKTLLGWGVREQVVDKIRLAAKLSGDAFANTLIEWGESLGEAEG